MAAMSVWHIPPQERKSTGMPVFGLNPVFRQMSAREGCFFLLFIVHFIACRADIGGIPYNPLVTTSPAADMGPPRTGFTYPGWAVPGHAPPGRLWPNPVGPVSTSDPPRHRFPCSRHGPPQTGLLLTRLGRHHPSRPTPLLPPLGLAPGRH
jgi:hypothetical protein